MKLGFSKNIVNIFLIGCILRIIIMPFLFHPDLKSQYFHAHFLGQGVFNIYDYIAKNKAVLGYKDTFNYPPLTYFILGSWDIVISPILGSSYNEWLNNWGGDWFTNDQIFRILFFLKIPYLIFDLLTGVVIYKLLEDKFKTKGLVFWLFNPISIYLIYGLSNFDIVPTFFTLFSIYLIRSNKFIFSGLSLGVAIATKLFPIMVLPFMCIYLLKKKNISHLVKFLFSTFLLFFISIIFLLKDFLQLPQSGLITKIFELGVNISLVHIPIFLIVYCSLIIYNFFIKNQFSNLISYSCLVFIMVLCVTQFHPQWMIWMLPFLIILITPLKTRFLIFFLFGLSLLVMTLSFFDRFLFFGVFSPIIPNIYQLELVEKTISTHISANMLIVISEVINSILFFYLFFKKYKNVI